MEIIKEVKIIIPIILLGYLTGALYTGLTKDKLTNESIQIYLDIFYTTSKSS
jgi:hypothetical protein